MVEIDDTVSQASAADSAYAFAARAWKLHRTKRRTKPQSRRMGMVAEHTRPSFQPMIQEIAIAVTMVVISWRMAPKIAPLIPARSVVLFERVDVREPVEVRGESK
jgi:hypothetical protein